jgi:hypothetical protein
MNDFNLQINPEGYLVFFMGGLSDFGLVLTSDEPLEDYRWYHVAFTIYYADPTARNPTGVFLYLDGEMEEIYFEETSWSPLYSRRLLTDEPIALGAYHNDDPLWPDGQWFTGKIDEVRFWKGVRGRSYTSPSGGFANRSISGDETWLQPAPEGTSDVALVAAYNFNQGSGETLVDQGPNGFDGIIHSPVDWSISELNLTTHVDVVGTVAVAIDLLALDSLSQDNLVYVIAYDPNTAGGRFYAEGALLESPTIPYGLRDSLPTLGVEITSGGYVTTPRIIFVAHESYNGLGDFFYYARSVSSGEVSIPTHVVLHIDCCCQPGDVIDACGVCNGNNRTLDSCLICGGDGTSCDCAPPLSLDICGVCGGDGSSCLGCDGVSRNPPVLNDICGVCGGDGSSCLGCDGLYYPPPLMIPVVDACGVCGGLNDSCYLDCEGVKNGPKVVDACGVCGGANDSCYLDCEGVKNGPKVVDACGVCGGENRTCTGCDGVVVIPPGLPAEFDACGVCNGDGSSCQCIDYHGFSKDTMEYVLIEYTIDRTTERIENILTTLEITLETLQQYSGSGDLGVMLHYLSQFSDECADDYLTFLEDFLFDLSQQLGLE